MEKHKAALPVRWHCALSVAYFRFHFTAETLAVPMWPELAR